MIDAGCRHSANGFMHLRHDASGGTHVPQLFGGPARQSPHSDASASGVDGSSEQPEDGLWRADPIDHGEPALVLVVLDQRSRLFFV